MNSKACCLLAVLIAFPPTVFAEGSEFQNLDDQVQGAKEEVLQINHELMLLQEKLLHPSSTEVSLFLSLQASGKFSLDSASLSVDGKRVDEHLYTYREVEALRKGGVQRLHTANLTSGAHKVRLTVSGHTDSNSKYSKTRDFTVTKGPGPRLVEFNIVPAAGSPDIKMKVWQ